MKAPGRRTQDCGERGATIRPRRAGSTLAGINGWALPKRHGDDRLGKCRLTHAFRMNHQSDLVPDHTLEAGWIIRDVRHVGAPLLAPSWSIGPCRRTQEGEL